MSTSCRLLVIIVAISQRTQESYDDDVVLKLLTKTGIVTPSRSNYSRTEATFRHLRLRYYAMSMPLLPSCLS